MNDLTNVIWDEFLPYHWRERLLPESERGLISATELMRRGYADVTQNQDAILSLIRARIQIRRGFDRLLSTCADRDWAFVILSNGLRFYIEAAVGSHLQIWAHEATYDDGRWHVAVPPSIQLRPLEDFKSHIVARLRASHPDAPFVYIGDGRLDFEPAILCEHVWCVRGSTLEIRCSDAGIPNQGFDDFDEVREGMERQFPRSA